MINVTLRKKRLKKSRSSLYLDFYPPVRLADGTSTRREFLKLYLFTKPKSPAQKRHNQMIEEQAQLICTRRIIQIADGVYQLHRLKQNQDFIKFFEEMVQTKKENTSISNYRIWNSTLAHLRKASGGKVLLSNIESFAEAFRGYLNGLELKRNSKAIYFGKFKAALIAATKRKLLDVNTVNAIDRITFVETKKTFLTPDEIQKLAETPFEKYPQLKRASLFSVLTGLRFVDIRQLKWKDVIKLPDGFAVHLINQKTQNIQLDPITDEARSLLGDRKDKNTKVLPNLRKHQKEHLHVWAGKAGITKHLTFHVFRHSVAVMLLNDGESMYTVSKVLGHKSIKTTEIYSQLLTATKRRAINKLTLKNTGKEKKK